jgi:hypothetical protein
MGKSSKTRILPQASMTSSPAPTIEEFVEYQDAVSRISIDLVNVANSWRIRQYGCLPPDATRIGFIAWNVTISDDVSHVQILSPVQPQYGPLDPLTWTWEQMVPLFNSMMPGEIEQIVHISPYEMPELLTRLTGRRDYVFLSRATGLDKCDYDTICGTMARAFWEDSDQYQVPGNCIPLPIYDHHGVFVRMNAFFNGAVFELKTFTHMNLTGPFTFPFRPDHTGICFNTPAASKLPFRRALGGGLIPLFDEIVLDTRIEEVLTGRSPANAILILAGNYAGLDRVLFPGHKAFLLWRPDEPCSPQEFATNLNFVAAAKKLGFTIHIRQYPGNIVMGVGDLAKQAKRFHLPFPDEMKEHAGTIKHDEFEDDGRDSVAETNKTNHKEI